MPVHHPDTKLFPMLVDDELRDLAEDIRVNGLREPIMLDHTGEFLIDGRNRESACGLAGVELRYDRLPVEQDIFAYVISTNLRRRHLTDAQRREIVLKIKERNPDLSNRQIAKMADVHSTTVDRTLARSTAAHAAVEHRTVGKDGKSRPMDNRISDAKRMAIIADIKANPIAQRDIALKHGVSVGTVAGLKTKLKKAGEIRSPIAQQLERRAAVVPRYDNMTREERGMGSREYGAEQHPDYPPGWTRDNVHREKYGRIQLWTPDQHKERELVGRFQRMIVALQSVVTDAPSVDDLLSIGDKSREGIEFMLLKFGPEVITRLSAYIDGLSNGPN